MGIKKQIQEVISSVQKITKPMIVLGPFTSEEEGDEIRKSIERGICPRDGHSFSGKEFCPGCGGNVKVILATVKRFGK